MKSESLFKPPLTKKIKAGRVELMPNEEVGEHITEKREEIIIVLNGAATLHIDGGTIEINEGETHYIGEEKRHNVVNNTSEKLEYIYVVSLLD